MIIGIEGTSLTGKTTLARHLARRYVHSVAIPCYMELSGAVAPALVPGSAAEELEILRYFLTLEQERVDLASQADGIVLLDRTVDTLLAHALALERLYGLGTAADARSVVQSAVHLRPHVTFLLVAADDILRARRASRPDIPEILIEPEFVSIFNEHFDHSLSARCVMIDAAQPVALVVEQVVLEIGRLRRSG